MKAAMRNILKKTVPGGAVFTAVFALSAITAFALPRAGAYYDGEIASVSDLGREEETAEENTAFEEPVLRGARLGAAAADNWYEDYTYVKGGDRIFLSKYNGSDTVITIPATAEILGNVYQVCLDGPVFENNTQITSVSVEKGVKGFNLDALFSVCENLESVNLEGLDTSGSTDMGGMFFECTKLSSLNLKGLDTSLVEDMDGMFENCQKLASLDLSGFNTSRVTNMGMMFMDCSGLTSLNVSSFDTSKVTDMNSMFYKCSSLTSLDVSGFDTSQVEDMAVMFRECSGLTSLDVSGFNTSKVTNMGSLFNRCSSLTSLDLSNFDMSGVADSDSALGMLYYTRSLKEIYVPRNVVCDVLLQKTFYDEGGNEYTLLPKNLTASIRLTDSIEVKSVRLNCVSAFLEPGSSLQLTPIFTPTSATNQAVSWSSSNPSVAGVDENGLVTVQGYGTAVITVTTEDGGKTAKCKIMVMCGTPVLKTLSNKSTGVNVSWKTVPGATKYRVYRKTANSSFVKLTDTAGTSFVDSGAVSGTAYTYTVCCLSPDGAEVISERDETGKTITYLATPVVNAPTSAAAGVRVSWPTVKGASKYVIMRHVGAGAPSWKWLKTVNAETGTSQGYTDTSPDIESGTWYAYTIRALTFEGTYSGQVGGRSIKYLAPVEVNKVQSVSTGVRVTFTNVNGGYTYRLYRSTKGSDGKFGDYVPIVDQAKVWNGSPETVWIHDNTAKKGTAYRYYVRCVSKDGAVPLSSYKNYLQITYK